MNETVADRVRKVMSAASSHQAAFASHIGLSADKLSKSLNGTRRFTSLDLARIAEAGSTTVDWLLSGREPKSPQTAARSRSPLTSFADPAAVEDQVGRFTSAYEALNLLDRSPGLPELPTPRSDLERYLDQGEALAQDSLAVLATYGVESVAGLEPADLARTLEEHFGIDVAQVRLPEYLDGVAWQSDDFRLVLLARTPLWTRQRFTLAHELGHILASDAQDLLAETHLAPGRQKDYTEIRANVFASHFLMPAEELRAAAEAAAHDSPPDQEISDQGFRSLVVRFKVSPSALAARLLQLGLISARTRHRLRGLSTELCHLLTDRIDIHQQRIAAADAERLPLRPARGLYAGYLAGDTTLRPLAAYLAMDVEELREAVEPDTAPHRPPADTEKGDPVFQP
jgi:Zn-dependent peptidase ImmA (M78 family)